MNQKERSLIVLKSILLNLKEVSQMATTKEKLGISMDYLIEKIDACLELVRPEVLLDSKEMGIFEKEVERLRRKGKII